MILDILQKTSLKNKISASLAFFVIAFFCLIYFIVIPTMRDIKVMGQDIENQRIDLETKYIKGYTLKQLTENLKEIQPKLSQLDQVFINKNRELEFITTLENRADQASVNQKINLSSPQTAANQKFQKNSLQLSTQGEFNQQLKYLMDLEALSYYINVNLIELTPTNGSETAGVISQTNSASNQASRINMLINADTYWE
jgi:Tfp pilus assembly protein PilO